VDDDDERLLRHLRESCGDRRGARLTTRDAGDDLRRHELLREQDRRLLPPGRGSDDDRVDQRAVVEPLDALGQQRTLAEDGERLRTIDSEPLAGAGSGDQRPDTSGFAGNV
jgi:hypothetical protein